MFNISVITINFNNCNGLIKTVDSVLNQSLNNFEFIIIDGGSTDGSLEFLHNKSSYFTSWKSEPDNGIYHAMNKGIDLSSGDYLLFLNSGDILFNKFSLEKSLFSLTGEDLIYGDLAFVNNVKNGIWRYPRKPFLGWVFNFSLPHPSTFIRKKLFESVGGFNELDKISSDWQFFMKAIFINNCSYKKINVVVSSFYYGGISTSTINKEVLQNERNRFIKEFFPELSTPIINSLLQDQCELYELSLNRLFKLFNFLLFKRMSFFLKNKFN